MRALVQRVLRASVRVGDEEVGAIGPGLLVFVGVGTGDTNRDLDYLAEKIPRLRIFSDAQGRFTDSLVDVQGSVLLVSQFTLYADTRRGRRPSFIGALEPEYAQVMIHDLAQSLKRQGLDVEEGRFGAHMVVQSWNDGPVTIMIDSGDLSKRRRV